MSTTPFPSLQYFKINPTMISIELPTNPSGTHIYATASFLSSPSASPIPSSPSNRTLFKLYFYANCLPKRIDTQLKLVAQAPKRLPLSTHTHTSYEVCGEGAGEGEALPLFCSDFISFEVVQ